jgi:isoquinoline 1-oxidoreductase beta subunit
MLHPHHQAALELAAEKASCGRVLPLGRYQGVAVYRSFGSDMAEVAEISVAVSGFRVHRFVCAIDCGRIAYPAAIRARIEGGVAFGLSAALKEMITNADGRVQQASFEDYPVLMPAEVSEVEVHIVVSTDPSRGLGEPGVAAQAVANALAAVTGKRPHSLPLRVDA